MLQYALDMNTPKQQAATWLAIYKLAKQLEDKREGKPMNTPEQRTLNLLSYFGYAGGTIHQLAGETGVDAQTLLYGDVSEKHLTTDHCAGQFALRTCSKAHRLGFVEARKGNKDFWLGVADAFFDY